MFGYCRLILETENVVYAYEMCYILNVYTGKSMM